MESVESNGSQIQFLCPDCKHQASGPPCDHLSTIMGKIHAPWALGGVPSSNLRVGVFASRGDLSESTTGRFVMNEKSCPKTFFIIGFLFTTL